MSFLSKLFSRKETNKGFMMPPQIYVEDLGDGVNLEMIWIPAGTFQMGSEEDDNQKPIHAVELDGFWLGKYPVTQAQYMTVIGSNPSCFDGANNPVERVSWDDATKFCEKISQKTGKIYALPSEAQWEYACRAGSQGKYCFGDSWNSLGKYAWFIGNSKEQTHPVGQKKANTWGLFDMHGNVWEWCADWHDQEYYAQSPKRNPTGPAHGTARVLRGGSWDFFPDGCSAARRRSRGPADRDRSFGLRLARTEK
ncbi:MAG: formylglycine-generating enzyme family protein [Candidatus Sumerlaeota bacterium]|nr:formylglycine-generating enzyme family protein [Candidatus Sumerlaeota bacterium]